MKMGVEIEFGMFDGADLSKSMAVYEEVLKIIPGIRAKRSGYFLANGGKAYVDMGHQNEYCTPETKSPEEMVKHEMAGRKLMSRAAMKAGLKLLCSNYDPVHLTTWGLHENYSSRILCDRGPLSLPLRNHLITRIIYTGAGGISPAHPGVSPILSPRVTFIRGNWQCQGTAMKTLLFNKLRDYGDSNRIHVVCGETLLSHFASYLRNATTALVIEGINAGVEFPEISFRYPIFRVLNHINRDTSIAARFSMVDGRNLSAIDIQEMILVSLEKHSGQLPSWADKAMERWQTVLDQLRNESDKLADKLDWMIFRNLQNRLADESGISQQALRSSNEQLLLQNKFSPLPAALKPVRALRNAAIELYIRLHVLGSDSLFKELDEEGVLNHHLSEITPEDIEWAVTEPPSGRATTRSELIKRYNRDAGLWMSWHQLLDGKSRPSVELCGAPTPGFYIDAPSVRSQTDNAIDQQIWEGELYDRMYPNEEAHFTPAG